MKSRFLVPRKRGTEPSVLFAVSRRFSLQPSCHLAAVPLSSFSPLSLPPLSRHSLLPRPAPPPPAGPLFSRLLSPFGAAPPSLLHILGCVLVGTPQFFFFPSSPSKSKQVSVNGIESSVIKGLHALLPRRGGATRCQQICLSARPCGPALLDAGASPGDARDRALAGRGRARGVAAVRACLFPRRRSPMSPPRACGSTPRWRRL